tara:strand:+ start:253 stop:1203 length:951 start_codon:yes stop_codon:yes gene_type:complete
MKKLTSIGNFKEGYQVQGFYICVEKNLRYTKGGDLYIDLELRDITGNINAKIWDNISELNLKFEKGDAVAISGYIESYLDHLQLIIKKINKATIQYYGRYGFDPVKIVPSSKKDPQKMWESIIAIVKELKNKELQKLIFLIFKSNKKEILIHPGSIKSSYNFRSGFLEQALDMAQIAKKLAPFYKLDKEIVIVGVLLIKIGVLKGIKSGYITDYSKEGNMLGESVIARDIFNSTLKKIKNFPKDSRIKLEHILLSYENNFQPKTSYRPSFPEALLVHFIYKMNSNMNLMERIILDDNEENDFTSIHNHFRLPLLKK